MKEKMERFRSKAVGIGIGIVSAVALVAVAAEPVWPTDFEQQLARRVESIRAANSTDVSPGATLDSARGSVGDCVFGSDESPFDSFYNFSAESQPSRLNANEPRGLFIYVR